MAQEVADIEAPGRGDGNRKDLQPEHPVQPQQLGEPGPAAEEEGGLLTADRDHWHQRDVGVERESDEALASREVDPVSLPGGAMDLPVTARIHEKRGAGVERRAGALR